VRDKRGRLVSPLVLLRLGQKLMAKWQSRPAHDPRLNAMDYRDGFMIALLALCPLRLENLAAVVIGQHLTFASERPRLAFTADEMKGRRSLEFDVPTALHVKLAFYLTDIHPMLYRGPQLGAPLWPSLHTDKPKMSEHGIYTRITQVTEKHLGHPISPHMFRDAAATFITELVPEHAMMAASVLQHANLDVTMRHYVHGQQHLAALKYHAAIDDMIARMATEPVDL
jgi:integrase/recombinase XerD